MIVTRTVSSFPCHAEKTAAVGTATKKNQLKKPATKKPMMKHTTKRTTPTKARPEKRGGQMERYKFQGQDKSCEYTDCVVQCSLKRAMKTNWYRRLHKLIDSDAQDVPEMINVLSLYINHLANVMSSEDGIRQHPDFFK